MAWSQPIATRNSKSWISVTVQRWYFETQRNSHPHIHRCHGVHHWYLGGWYSAISVCWKQIFTSIVPLRQQESGGLRIGAYVLLSLPIWKINMGGKKTWSPLDPQKSGTSSNVAGALFVLTVSPRCRIRWISKKFEMESRHLVGTKVFCSRGDTPRPPVLFDVCFDSDLPEVGGMVGGGRCWDCWEAHYMDEHTQFLSSSEVGRLTYHLFFQSQKKVSVQICAVNFACSWALDILLGIRGAREA